MAELEGLQAAGEAWRLAHERRRRRGEGRDPRHRRAPEDARRRWRGAPAGPRREPLRELRRTADARPYGGRRGRRRLGAPGGAHAGRRGRRGRRPASRRGADRAGRLPRAGLRAPEDQRPLRHGGRGGPRRGRRQRRAHARRGVGRHAGRRARRLVHLCRAAAQQRVPARRDSSSTTTGASPPTRRCRPSSPACSRPGSCAAARSGRPRSRPARARRPPRRRIATWTPARGQTANRQRRPRPPEATEAHMAEKLTVHDPRGYPPQVTGKPLAPRLQSLEGKTLYLVDCLFDNSEAFVDQLHALVRRAHARRRYQAHQAARELGRRPGDVRGDPGRRRRRHPRGRPLKHL